jgi:hypothetical protein
MKVACVCKRSDIERDLLDRSHPGRAPSRDALRVKPTAPHARTRHWTEVWRINRAVPDTVADQLGLEAVDEALRGGVVEGVADGADRGLHAVVVEGLAVVERGVLAAGGSTSDQACADRSSCVSILRM